MRMLSLCLVAAATLALQGCERATRTENNEAAPSRMTAATGSGTIAEDLAASADDRRFLDALRAAGLEPALAGRGPYTVLAPANGAFDKLPAAASAALMKPEGRARLVAILTTHVLPGTILAGDIRKAIDSGGGKAVLATMGDATLTATRDGDTIVLTDGAGGKAAIVKGDETLANGVVHRVDAVLMPSAAT